MKANIVQAKVAISEARSRQDEASKDVKRIERDISEFSKNKDSKLEELQVSLEKLKKTLMKASAANKPLQQEARERKLEMEQCGGDLITVQEALEEKQSLLNAQLEELAVLTRDHARLKVSPSHYLQRKVRLLTRLRRMRTTWHKHSLMTRERSSPVSRRN